MQRQLSSSVVLIGVADETVVVGRSAYLSLFDGFRAIRQRLESAGILLKLSTVGNATGTVETNATNASNDMNVTAGSGARDTASGPPIARGTTCEEAGSIAVTGIEVATQKLMSWEGQGAGEGTVAVRWE